MFITPALMEKEGEKASKWGKIRSVFVISHLQTIKRGVIANNFRLARVCYTKFSLDGEVMLLLEFYEGIGGMG